MNNLARKEHNCLANSKAARDRYLKKILMTFDGDEYLC